MQELTLAPVRIHLTMTCIESSPPKERAPRAAPVSPPYPSTSTSSQPLHPLPSIIYYTKAKRCFKSTHHHIHKPSPSSLPAIPIHALSLLPRCPCPLPQPNLPRQLPANFLPDYNAARLQCLRCLVAKPVTKKKNNSKPANARLISGKCGRSATIGRGRGGARWYVALLSY